MQRAFELKLSSVANTGEFEGIASTYGNIDSVDDIVEPGAFTKTLAASKERPLLWQHRDPIGTVTLTDSPSGLLAKGKLTMAVVQAQEALALMRDGAVRGLSIGFETVKAAWSGDQTIRYLQEIKLWEVSLVTFPANSLATVTSVKSADLARISTDINEFKSALLRAIER